MAEAMAVMKLAGPFITPVIRDLAEKASPYFGGDATAGKLENLRITVLPQIQLIIDAAGDADKDVAALGPWLSKLRGAALESDDVLDELEYRRLEEQANPPAPVLGTIRKCSKKVKEFASPVLFKTKLRKRVDELEKIASEAGRFVKLLGLHRDSRPNPNADHGRDTSVPSPPPIVVGRERECEHWVRVLTTPTDEEAKASTQRWRAPVHAIRGIGGAGKTTLAQSVFNDPRIEAQFGDMRIWAHLPRKLDVAQVTRAMIEFITKGECPRMETLAALQAKLRKIFEESKEKILLVLDDLWVDKSEDRIQLETLLQPLNEVGRVGSMVLMTTRMEGAAAMLGDTNIVPIEELDDDKCRSIILHYAGKGIGELDAEKKWALSTIVPKLKSSPLAARLVGIWLCVVDDWNVVARGAMLEGTKNALLWSFKRLPSHLRSCFAFCSLYPKGFIFSKRNVDELVRFWISQGFVEEPTEAEKDLTIEEKGKLCFNELRFFSFFQQHPQYKDNFVMHDLLHDLAEDVSHGHCFRIEDNVATTDIPPTVIHLSIAASGMLAVPIPDLMERVNLRTFLILDIPDDDFKAILQRAEEMFKKLAKLKLLHFGRYRCLNGLNISMGELKHLRYLQGAAPARSFGLETDYHPVKLHESLGTLYHLKYIHLMSDTLNSDHIHIAHKSLNNLVKLRHLSPHGLYSKIDDIGKLTSVQELRVYSADRTKQYGLQQLEKLQQIRGRLKIEGLEFLKDKAGATVAMLKEKRHLEDLVLKWSYDRADDVNPDTDMAVLEGLEPHPNLKQLRIKGYRGVNPPSWMGMVNNQHFLPNLTSLKLRHCPNLNAVPNLPCRLRKLKVWSCDKLMHPFPCSLESCLSGAVASYNKIEQPQHQHPLSTGSSSALRSLKIGDGCALEENTLDEFLMSNKFPSLSKVQFGMLPSVTFLLLGPHLTALEDLTIVGLENLKSIKGIGSLKSLKRLTVIKCPDLKMNAGAGGEIDDGDCMPSFLMVGELLLLPALLQERCLNSLEKLKISHCSQDVPFNDEQEGIFLHLTSLKSISFEWCENLPSLPKTLVKLSSVKKLDITGCGKIESLPDLPSSLRSLRIRYCHPQLKVNYEEGGTLRHEINRIPRINIR